MRTTIDIDATVLEELRRRRDAQGTTLGKLVSELLAVALAVEDTPSAPPFGWTSQAMRARIALEDREALERAMEGDG